MAIFHSRRGAADGEMSAEYVLKMDALRRSREELTAKRLEIERRIALREATAAEYRTIALQSAKHKWKSLRASAIAAKRKNDEFIREVHETKRKVDEAYVRTKQKLWPSDNQLEIEKARYLHKVEEMYPAWQEKMQAVRVQTLRELEEKKRAIEKRRYLAKKTFETEQTLDDLIQQTSHEIGLAENMEKNEAMERELLRAQSAIQAMQLDESIRDHAAGARMYMARQAAGQLSAAQRVHPDIENRIFETFSPRRAVKAMREANESISIVNTIDNNNADEDYEQPRRTQSIVVPTQYLSNRDGMNRPLPDPYLNTRDTQARFGDPSAADGANVRVWGGLGIPYAEGQSTILPVVPSALHAPQNVQGEMASIGNTIEQCSELQQLPEKMPDEPRQEAVPPVTLTRAVEHSPSPADRAELAEAFRGLSSLDTGRKNSLNANERSPVDKERVVYPSSADTEINFKSDGISKVKQAFDSISSTSADLTVPEVAPATIDAPNVEHIGETRTTSVHQVDCASKTPKEAPQTRSEDMHCQNDATEGGASSFSPTMQINTPPTTEIREPFLAQYNTYKFVEVTQGTSKEASQKDTGDEGKPSHSLDSESKQLSPAKSEAPEPADLTINLITSFDSNQSSVMDFSIGKLLTTPPRESKHFSSAISDFHDPASSPELVTSTHSDTKPSSETHISASDGAAVSVSRSFGDSGSSSLSPEPVILESKPQKEPQDMKSKAVPGMIESLVLSSLESVSEVGSPAQRNADDVGLMIEAKSEVGSPVPEASVNASDTDAASAAELLPAHAIAASPTMSIEAQKLSQPSLFASVPMPERLKALTSLIARVEEGVGEGEQVRGTAENECSYETKRDLIRMAVSGRRAQINFFGPDVCFDLVVDLARELGPVLFPAKAFEGILNEQKMKKVYQNSKEKEADMWKAFSSHMKQLQTLKAIPVSSLVDTFTSAFLSADLANQRSQRKLRELLFAVCGASDSTPKKDSATMPPQREASPDKSLLQPTSQQDRETPSTPQIPNLLQTAFLQAPSSPKTKSYGIASSSFKKKSSTDDVLKSMASSPTKLSQKLMRGGKMGDYSEFEEEDEVDLENLIGSKSSATTAVSRTAINPAKASTSARGGQRLGAMREDKDEFDVDF